MSEIKIHLRQEYFSEAEHELVSAGLLSASTLRYPSGVAGLRLHNELGELVLLPFQGQQIWSASFGGRNLTMKSMFSQPIPTRAYLETYGGFLVHCGATAMGVPAAGDTHALHGELPNAPYIDAWLTLGEDERGAYMGLSGRYQYTVAFSHNYAAQPTTRLYADSSVFFMGMEIVNLKRTPMELMYMAHVNFRPVDNGRLVYSAHCTPEHVRVRRTIPSHVKPGPGYVEYIEELAQHPERHNLLAPGLAFDPEVVFFIDYETDVNGWAHSLQVHPEGGADYISHRPDQLPKGVRWISRTPDQDCFGLVLPSTAEPEGYTAEKKKGNLVILPGGETWKCEMWAGHMDVAAAQAMEATIQSIIAGGG